MADSLSATQTSKYPVTSSLPKGHDPKRNKEQIHKKINELSHYIAFAIWSYPGEHAEVLNALQQNFNS